MSRLPLPRQLLSRPATGALLLAAALVLPACGGGGGGGGAPPGPGPEPPTNLTYSAMNVVYRTDAPIDPNLPDVSGGTPTAYDVAPALPLGLAIHGTTGVISGSPVTPTPVADYVVTASNDDGQTTATLTIEVLWIEHKSLAPEAVLDDADLRHFLIRTHWGVTDDKLASLNALGLAAFVDGMLVFPPIGSTSWEQEADRLLVNTNDPPGQEGMFPNRSQLIRWWLHLMKENDNPFQEVLAFTWHDHFATSSEVLGGGRLYYMKEHVNLLRDQGNGNLRDLLVGVARDWAMLWWLDGYVSTLRNPNENFAREFFELFCLGVDRGYLQQDIEEAARAFTGYQDQVLDPDTGLRHMVFVPARHDPNDKTIFGVTIPGQNVTDDYQAVVDLTVDNREVAEWISQSLLDAFCYTDPEVVLVDQLAQVMRDEAYALAPVLKTLFLSEAFFSDHARRSLVKSPVDHALGFIRSTGLRARVNELQGGLTLMGNVPTMPPTVDGWPGGSLWLSAQGMVDRANMLQTCISNARSLAEQATYGLDLRALLPPGTPSARECVDALALLLGTDLEETERVRLADYLDTERLPDGSVVPSPFDANDPDHVDERIRGLLYILGQHPNYMVR